MSYECYLSEAKLCKRKRVKSYILKFEIWDTDQDTCEIKWFQMRSKDDVKEVKDYTSLPHGKSVARHRLPPKVDEFVRTYEECNSYATFVCELCAKKDHVERLIQTEDGYDVGECCSDELHQKSYQTEHRSETFYYLEV